MEDKIQSLLKINSVHYPRELARLYPAILNKIVNLRESEKIDDYFSELIMDSRHNGSTALTLSETGKHRTIVDILSALSSNTPHRATQHGGT